MKIRTLKKILIGIILSLVFCLILACKVSTREKNDNVIATDSVETNTETISDTTSTNFSFTDFDEPPTPVQNPMPVYPVKYRSSGIQGTCLLLVTVKEDGTVANVIVKKSLLAGEGGLDEAAVTAVKSWIFKPAMKNKKPVQATVEIPIAFNLNTR